MIKVEFDRFCGQMEIACKQSFADESSAGSEFSNLIKEISGLQDKDFGDIVAKEAKEAR